MHIHSQKCLPQKIFVFRHRISLGIKRAIVTRGSCECWCQHNLKLWLGCMLCDWEIGFRLSPEVEISLFSTALRPHEGPTLFLV